MRGIGQDQIDHEIQRIMMMELEALVRKLDAEVRDLKMERDALLDLVRNLTENKWTRPTE